MANKNRDKGHRLERYWAKVFRDDLGFKFCKTARAESRTMDNCQVDLVNIPINVQIKNGYRKGLNYEGILSKMTELLAENYPPIAEVHRYPNVIIHKKGLKKNEHLVIMNSEDFTKLVQMAYKNDN